MDKLIKAVQPTQPKTASFLIGRVEREFGAMGDRFKLHHLPEADDMPETAGYLSDAAAAIQQAIDILKEASISMTCTKDHLLSIRESRQCAGLPEGQGIDLMIVDAMDGEHAIGTAIDLLVADAWPQGEPDEDLGDDASAPAAPDAVASVVER